MLTTFDLDEYVLVAIRAGASGFLLKDAPPEEMLAAIRTVHSGDAVIAPSRRGGCSSTSSPRSRPRSRLVATEPAGRRSPTSPTASARCSSSWRAGAPTPRSARDLFVAEATVKTHVGRILAKLGARDRVQAVVVGVRDRSGASGRLRRCGAPVNGPCRVVSAARVSASVGR